MNSKSVVIGTVMLSALAATAQNQEQTAPAPAQPDAAREEQVIRATGDQRQSAPGEREPAPELPPGPVGPSVGASRGAPLAGTSQLGAPAAFGGAAVFGRHELLRWGPLNFHPHPSYTVSYGNSLQASPGKEVNTWVQEFAPGVLVNIGDHWSLDYTPTFRWYDSASFEDTVDHSVAFSGRTSYQDWIFGVSQSYATTSQPLVETASQTDEETWATALTARRALNSVLFLDLGLNQQLRYVQGNGELGALNDSLQWSTMDWLGYQYAPELDFGVGAGFTYDDVERGSDMTSEQIQARVGYRPGTKLELSLSGGADIRQFLDSSEPVSVSPIFNLAATYRVFENTILIANASQTLRPSYYEDALTESIGVNLGVTQRLLGRLSLNVNAGYSQTSLSGTSGSGSSPATTADYESTSINGSLAMPFLQRGSVSLFYNKTFNNSDSNGYNLDPQTVGVQIFYFF